MNKEYLNVVLIETLDENVKLFKNIFNDVKVGVKLSTFESTEEVLDYLNDDHTLAPEIIFINYDVFNDNFLEEVRRTENLRRIIIATHSEKISEDEIDDFFVKSGNICIKKTDNEQTFKKKISEVITVNWQYYTSGLNKDNFILKI